ncbi:MAG: D-3-phosphoglycerate dehydrogenase [Cycloclasticus pugetii]|jgi:D-3-phosphoglycerate dehydrogenase|uniref:D-3-phosphoglycerate dehydrogenase n=1 Tax=Cycloclasticus zancles 78-ME TaxID=1198232 RepID=S5TH63_9GAMM|nr:MULTISPECIES: phosphoglycerate dehydrogenase [Cycloclasticus]AGS40227.1 D-3-phosphoglycerate dehydrogenase [Cycloclasticus zancles 78-ME]MDF1829059.1 phosphoglycerate dehydrogenase [Cycloclasticus pugetii]
MYKIQTLNNISVKGLEKFPRETYEVASEIQNPDAYMLRSLKLHNVDIPESVLAIGRAGAGVNNIPIEKMSARGVPVFNAPGANANAVKELVLTGMLLGCRNICQAWECAKNLTGDDESISKEVEQVKKKFVGFELPGRTLGVIGLGAIGTSVANMARDLGMNVVGYDPALTVERAWQLSSSIESANTVDELLAKSDFVTIHVPFNEGTKNLINARRINTMNDNAIILNFSRNGIVNDEDAVEALNAGKLYSYICDFPSNLLKDHPRVITLPHLGASTGEAEENCAIMIADQLKDFLENGNIKNSVNFPQVKMPRVSGYRMAIANSNVPNMVGQISSILAETGHNILDLLNKSRGDLAYTLLDVDTEITKDVVDQIKAIDGVLSVRTI